MTFDIGTIIAIAAVLLFYLRLILLQRQKVKQLSRTASNSPKKASKSKNTNQPSAVPRLEIANGYFVGAGVLLILAGVVVTAVMGVPPTLRDLWWVLVTLGVLLMSLGIR